MATNPRIKIASGHERPRLPAPSYRPASYLVPGFPVLASMYAFYRDDEFSSNEFSLWLNSQLDGKDFRGYLEPYQIGERPFPQEAEDLMAIEVPSTDPGPDGRYRPTKEMCERMVPHVVNELFERPAAAGKQHQPNNRQAVARNPTMPGDEREPPIPPSEKNLPVLDPERPLLSTLSVMFLKGDLTVWDTYAFAPDVRAVLGALAEGPTLDKKLAFERLQNELVAFKAQLANEFVSPPSTW